MNILEEALARQDELREAMFDGLKTNYGLVDDIDYGCLPATLIGGMRRYLEEGTVPGSFLKAVLENDLSGAVKTADGSNLILLPRIVSWVYLQIPMGAYGSREMVMKWAERKEKDASQNRV